jgi:hypothetical protein
VALYQQSRALSTICQKERFESKRDWILGLKDFSRLLEKKLGKYGFDAQYNFCIRLSASSWTRGISKKHSLNLLCLTLAPRSPYVTGFLLSPGSFLLLLTAVVVWLSRLKHTYMSETDTDLAQTAVIDKLQRYFCLAHSPAADID